MLKTLFQVYVIKVGKGEKGGGRGGSPSHQTQDYLPPHPFPLNVHPVLQRHCTVNSKQISPEMKLRGLVPIPIHIFPGSVRLFCCSKIGGLIMGIYNSLTDT
jgi:hypothetical protein